MQTLEYRIKTGQYPLDKFRSRLGGKSRPVVHGNGFIQLSLDESGDRRLHIWGHPEIPSQTVRTDIHDHVYGLKSVVLAGQLINVEWEASRKLDWMGGVPRDATHKIYVARTREGSDTVLEPLGGSSCCVRMVPVGLRLMSQSTGQPVYELAPRVFHSTFVSGPTATIMEKTGSWSDKIGGPRVAVPIDSEPDNKFTWDGYDPRFLMSILEEVLPSWQSYI